MDLLTVGIVLSLMAVGGGLVYWPMSLRLEALREALRESAKRNIALAAGIELERSIDAARDESPDSELRMLLDTEGALGEPSIDGTPLGREQVEDPKRQGEG